MIFSFTVISTLKWNILEAQRSISLKKLLFRIQEGFCCQADISCGLVPKCLLYWIVVPNSLMVRSQQRWFIVTRDTAINRSMTGRNDNFVNSTQICKFSGHG